jgi:hypothetical protein
MWAYQNHVTLDFSKPENPLIILRLNLSMANSEMNAHRSIGSFLWKTAEKKLRVLDGSIVTTDRIAALMIWLPKNLLTCRTNKENSTLNSLNIREDVKNLDSRLLNRFEKREGYIPTWTVWLLSILKMLPLMVRE